MHADTASETSARNRSYSKPYFTTAGVVNRKHSCRGHYGSPGVGRTRPRRSLLVLGSEKHNQQQA